MNGAILLKKLVLNYDEFVNQFHMRIAFRGIRFRLKTYRDFSSLPFNTGCRTTQYQTNCNFLPALFLMGASLVNFTKIKKETASRHMVHFRVYRNSHRMCDCRILKPLQRERVLNPSFIEARSQTKNARGTGEDGDKGWVIGTTEGLVSRGCIIFRWNWSFGNPANRV
jgi:hypothetical protein